MVETIRVLPGEIIEIWVMRNRYTSDVASYHAVQIGKNGGLSVLSDRKVEYGQFRNVVQEERKRHSQYYKKE
jgi:hypothetical protein